ncbi:swt1 RNA endoribonuclease [Cochliomyia hominivorax]
MDNKEKKKKDDWIRIASKSRPGRFYIFNKATGETQWLPLKKEDEVDKYKLDSHIKLSVSKTINTPAQDRLKRLQHNLKNGQTRAHASICKKTDVVTKAKEGRENRTCDIEPSTSFAITDISGKPQKKAIKRSQSHDVDNSKNRKISSSGKVKKIRLADTSNSIVIPNNDMEVASVSSVLIKPKLSDNNTTQNVEQINCSTLNNLRSGIVKKIKEICKMPFNVSKKINEEKSISIEENACLINKNQFKPAKKLKETKISSTQISKEGFNQNNEFNCETASNERTISLEFSTSKSLNIPSYTRGSVNSRLECLKQYLLIQQHEQKQLSDTINDIETLNEEKYLSFETNNNSTTLLHIDEDNHHSLNSANCLYHTPNSTINNEIEAMDWQPIFKDEESLEAPNSDNSLVAEKSKKRYTNVNDTNEKETMGDIYDTVNDNLLRFSAEKQKESVSNNKKLRKDSYYFIVDTNVLLRDLTFVEDLTKMKLCDTNGSILYIPYSVLQELDKLKMRSGFQEGVKTLAVRAIKYLNSKFESNSPHVQAQSALDERQHLVDINSADDSIINCCLQAKEHVPNLLLLTEDVNLRNKAICNNILVSTKSDLMLKRNGSCDRCNKS